MSDIRYIADKLYESNDEYISKRDASLAVNAVVTGCESKETMEALAAVLVNIYHVPLADVAPVVHGHWETPEKQFPFWDWKCSACGCEEYRQRDSHGNYRRMNFYPNCGAKMDESEDNDSK